MYKNESPSNYEAVYEHFREVFLSSDFKQTAKNLDLELREGFIVAPYFKRNALVSLKDGSVAFEDGGYIDVHDRLIILHHLCFAREDAFVSGEMLPFGRLKGVSPFEAAYRKSTLVPLSRAFEGKADKLRQICRLFGDENKSGADADFTFNVFPKISIRFIFYDACEEFPATVNMLFDKNITMFTHPETVPAMATALQNRLTV